jgi:hypothetical protein
MIEIQRGRASPASRRRGRATPAAGEKGRGRVGCRGEEEAAG